MVRFADERGVRIEMDTEAAPLIQYTIHKAIETVQKGHSLKLAIQAYLDRSLEDIRILIESGVGVRLVKGAYRGDIVDFFQIRQRYRDLAEFLFKRNALFDAATHDSELIGWLVEIGLHSRLRFGFVKGLADHIKLKLVEEGWEVSEYVPFGDEYQSYVLRRRNYLRRLKSLGLEPAP